MKIESSRDCTLCLGCARPPSSMWSPPVGSVATTVIAFWPEIRQVLGLAFVSASRFAVLLMTIMLATAVNETSLWRPVRVPVRFDADLMPSPRPRPR